MSDHPHDPARAGVSREEFQSTINYLMGLINGRVQGDGITITHDEQSDGTTIIHAVPIDVTPGLVVSDAVQEVSVTKTGGAVGDSTCDGTGTTCSYIYSVFDLGGNLLATGVTPNNKRVPYLPYLEGHNGLSWTKADGSVGLYVLDEIQNPPEGPINIFSDDPTELIQYNSSSGELKIGITPAQLRNGFVAKHDCDTVFKSVTLNTATPGSTYEVPTGFTVTATCGAGGVITVSVTVTSTKNVYGPSGQ